MIRRQFTVSGKVQGVWFRAGTREQALLLGLSGYAANLADGRVEVHAQGAAEAVAKLEQWLWQGPVLAKVGNIEVIEMTSIPEETVFRIL
ncbi:MAG TPA: acylphosphatase [Arenimonas sp.]|jgi:acylphosphatase|nr:acylphosphatase [Arenimonas sp.]